ncbi:MAG: tRNA (adenosine(37)-N6)-threonylcarbamoyltransferase complex ATPase subunit type 1 TsaE [Flavobacteriales bacterium]
MKAIFEAIASKEELEEVAKKFLLSFPTGGIFLLPSEMGSGKTTFCRHIIESMGYEFEGSPTFAIANHYRKANHPSLVHVDLYRVKTTAELIEMGFHDMISASDYIFIEWPEIAVGYLGSEHYILAIEILNGDSRRYRCLQANSVQ